MRQDAAPGTASQRYRDSSSHLSPLRYPGGKRKLANYLRLILRRNDLLDGDYAEVYAGGAAVALSLLFGEYVERIHINDLDRGVHAFWIAARDHSDDLCRLITSTKLDMTEWRRQRAVQADPDAELIDLAFSTFYLNRTNRSGIITGGPIGGYEQTGSWRLGARFSRQDLVARIQKVARHGSRIRIYNLDAAAFLADVLLQLPVRSLVYLDPPYFVKGQELLYANYYEPDDHARIAGLVRSLSRPWVVSYDDTPEIRKLYAGYHSISYRIAYSAHERYRGSEVMFFSDLLQVPAVENPSRLGNRDRLRLELAPS